MCVMRIVSYKHVLGMNFIDKLLFHSSSDQFDVGAGVEMEISVILM